MKDNEAPREPMTGDMRPSFGVSSVRIGQRVFQANSMQATRQIPYIKARTSEDVMERVSKL